MNSKLVWCVDCEQMVEMECAGVNGNLLCGHAKVVEERDENGAVMGVDIDFCDFPKGWESCPPPELPADWIENVVEPGDDEVLVIDVKSLELLSA